MFNVTEDFMSDQLLPLFNQVKSAVVQNMAFRQKNIKYLYSEYPDLPIIWNCVKSIYSIITPSTAFGLSSYELA